MREKLAELKRLSENVCVYSDDCNKFNYGRLLAVNDYDFAMLMYSPSGKYDGIIVRQIDDITRIEYGGQYEEKMQKLIDTDIDPESISLDTENIAVSLLKLAFKQEKIVAVELLDSGFENAVGFVEEISDSGCVIALVDEYGYQDGHCFFLINDITQILLDTEEEQQILRLWKMTK